MDGSEQTIPVDLVVLSIGLRPGTRPFAQELTLEKNGRVHVNSETLQTSIPWVFAAGDEVTPDALCKKSLAKSRYDILKILGDGELTKKLKVSAHRLRRRWPRRARRR